MDDLNEDQKENVNEILNAGQYLLHLINEILELSTIEAGKLELNISNFCLNESVKKCISLMQLMAANRGIRVIDKITDHAPINLIADPIRFKQVFLNLMSNAIKYNKENGIILLNYEYVENTQVKINVVDTGKGLTQEQLALLFNSFERLGVRGDEIEGTGIGLCITKRLVEAMRGKLSVSSKAGEGSCFSVTLPYLSSS
jgi:signal transduction histidine kinase